MLQLVQGGFGIATLPKAAILNLNDVRDVKPLTCRSPLLPLPIYVNYRLIPLQLLPNNC